MVTVAPGRNPLSLKMGWRLLGMPVKSGQRRSLKRFFFRVSMHSVLLWIVTALLRWPTSTSESIGRSFT